MRPRFNSFPHQPQQNGFQSSSTVGNQCNNNINMPMMQPPMDIFNPQLPIPMNNNTNNNPSVMPLLNNVGFMNGANQQFPTPNNSMGFPQFGPILPILNNLSMFQQLATQFNNPLHNLNQPNWLNLPQQNNTALTNGQQQQRQQQQQLFLQKQLQNMNQLLNAQLPDLSELVSGGRAMGCFNPTAVQNPHSGFMQPNPMQPQASQGQQNLIDVNASNLPTAAASQVQGDPSFRKPMGSPGKHGQNLNIFPGRSARRYRKKFQQPRLNQVDNAKGAFTSSNGHKRKGIGWSQNFFGNSDIVFKVGYPAHHRSFHFSSPWVKITGLDNGRTAKFPHSNSENPAKEKRRSLALTYTEQEIRQWREDRKKFYPTKANINKKLSGKVADTEVAKLRSEQLKEILAKQAELGVEVAEIPSHHLLGSEKKVNGREENCRLSTKRGRFGMRNDKRGKPDMRDCFSKKPSSTTEESFDGTCFNKRSPTLLQKLLSAEKRKDKSRLLQVFRFMIMNSFFKDWPEKPLKFPVVVAKVGVSEGEIIEEKPLLGAEDNIKVCNNTMNQGIVDAAAGDDDDVSSNNSEDDDEEEEGAKTVRNDGEEEEIID
ncbi:hypothetical protein V6N11_044539 [Hibiscus sabdariffa]|uniref:FMR1-interacting protein 1 conserved domain-containing protein n=1 Tax=Hibiscus sabdariffa TaxID=183260 RepID=A0ABR1ZIQ3_9ROSI